MEDDKKIVPFPGLAKSIVWNWFGFWQLGKSLDKSKAMCRLCKKEYSYQGMTMKHSLSIH